MSAGADEGATWPDAPDGSWPLDARGPDDALGALLDAAFAPGSPLAVTYAVVVVRAGRLVAERYGGAVPAWEGPGTPVGPGTALLSWSMAKSVLHAVVGLLIDDGRLQLDAPAPVPLWHERAGDGRGAITIRHLLEMRDGLDFVEDYVDSRRSDVIEMLFGAGRDDVAAFAADRPLVAAPGTRFNYSSGTSNILAGIVTRTLGGREAVERFVRGRLFDPLAMGSARLGFDTAGTWVASSFVHATARDWARFGLLYLRGGRAGARRVLPASWVDQGRTPRSVDPTDGALHGAHWWVVGDRHGSFRAAGYEGQSVLVCPGLDLVVVRLGRTPAERYPDLDRWRRAMVDAVGAGHGTGTDTDTGTGGGAAPPGPS